MSNDREPRLIPPEAAWPELQARLDALRGQVARMLLDGHGAADVYGRFARKAEAIVESAPPDLVESVHSELGSILRDLKLTGDSAD